MQCTCQFPLEQSNSATFLKDDHAILVVINAKCLMKLYLFTIITTHDN